MAQTDQQFNIRQYFDTLLATTFENRRVMEMPVERAEYMNPLVQCFGGHPKPANEGQLKTGHVGICLTQVDPTYCGFVFGLGLG